MRVVYFRDRVNFKSVCFLLSLCHAGSSTALGLGDVSVRSHLGQRLHAVVPLIGMTSAITTDCLSLAGSPGGIAPLPPARLSIEQVGGQSLLHIRTTQSVNDPVTQFVLVSDCEAHLQREYAVLLDPPEIVEMASGRYVDDAETQQDLTGMAAAIAPAEPVRSRPARVKPEAPATATRANAMRAPASAAKPRQSTAQPRPRLVLSGKRGVGSPLALRLDTTLSTPGQFGAGAVMSPTDLSDENTALNHRIAYMEAQLLALQQRNASLERSRTATPVAVVPPPKPSSQWLLYLLLAGVLTGVGAWVVGWRRRSGGRSASTMHIGEPWEQPETASTDQAIEPDREPLAPASLRMVEIAAPPGDGGTELKEDILDQAEVFMAHGHGELAIHLLQEHLREAPAESPVPWLLLLDLLHRAGDNAGYVAASTECRRYFNVNLDGRAFFSEGDDGKGLEAYPHLLEQMGKVWGTPDIVAFFEDLVFDHRGGTRIGFEPGAYRDILLLRSISHDIAPTQQTARSSG